jgi:biopolymer transport protein TolQ
VGHHERFPSDRRAAFHQPHRSRPAIAEALFATAIGLVAAIPAYIAYNKFSADAARYSARLEGFADELVAAVTRRSAAGG